ncbi:transmembrane protein [Cystoisospora suis]|uniref:Transmembrane protein n=1 Tax=Cystoisospora suis TaxID=483139 RepID=A0A2C6KZP7_9APIC|nr:transmembrane protein [Cystoisospora suis]
MVRQMHAADVRLIEKVLEGAKALHRAAQLREEVAHAVELISQHEEEVSKSSDCRFLALSAAEAELHARASWMFLFFGCLLGMAGLTATFFLLAWIHLKVREGQVSRKERKKEELTTTTQVYVHHQLLLPQAYVHIHIERETGAKRSCYYSRFASMRIMKQRPSSGLIRYRQRTSESTGSNLQSLRKDVMLLFLEGGLPLLSRL